jgi:hypothetical protein
LIKILVELRDKLGRVAALSDRRESAHVAEEHSDVLADADHAIEEALRIVDEFFDDITRDVAFEGVTELCFLEALDELLPNDCDECGSGQCQDGTERKRYEILMIEEPNCRKEATPGDEAGQYDSK